MTWTYVDPGASAKDAIRFAVGDTDERRPQLSDEEIAYCYTRAGNNLGQASVYACQSIIAKLARLCDQTVGNVSKSFSQLQTTYRATLATLEQNAVFTGGVPFVGGVSLTANRAPYGSPDYNRPQYTTKMMQRRGRGGALYGMGSLTAGNEPQAPEDGN